MTQKTSIKNYRRIGNWENFFLDSAIYSVANSLGITYENEKTPIAAITGDLFTYLYSDSAPCDSGVTNYVQMPDTVLKVYDSFGYGCDYLSTEVINSNLTGTLEKIRASVDRGIPVLAWGVGGVLGVDGERYDPMGEGALIGGYDGEYLLVHLYCGAERLPSLMWDGRPGYDEDGYTAIPAKEALATTHGIFIVTEKKTQPDLATVYRNAILSIPRWLTLPSTGHWVFGQAAFAKWAEVLLDDANWQTVEMCNENQIWNKHCSPFCTLCTSTGAWGGDSPVVDYLKRAATACPEWTLVQELIPLYCRMTDLFGKIWTAHGDDFMPSAEKITDHVCREELAYALHQMGECCDDILRVFQKEGAWGWAKEHQN